MLLLKQHSCFYFFGCMIFSLRHFLVIKNYLNEFLYKILMSYHSSFLWRLINLNKKIYKIKSLPIDICKGDAKIGQAIVNGFFFTSDVNGNIFQEPWSDLYRLFNKSNLFSQYINSFSWIRDLKATGDMSARRLARRMIEFWIINSFTKKNSSKQNMFVSAKRLSNWTLLYDFFGTSAQDSFKKIFFLGIQKEYKNIKKHLLKKYDLYEEVTIIKSLIEFNTYWYNDDLFFELLLKKLCILLNKLKDDNNVMSTDMMFVIYKNLIETRNSLRQYEKFFLNNRKKMFLTTFENIQIVLQKITSTIRFFRHSNGTLCSINNSKMTDVFFENITAEKVDTALSQIEFSTYNDFNVNNVAKVSKKHSALFIDLKIKNPKVKKIKDIGNNIANEVMNIEWSSDQSNIVKETQTLIFQNDSIPIFFKKNIKQENLNKNIWNEIEDEDISCVCFRGYLDSKRTMYNLYSFGRELRLFADNNLLNCTDTIILSEKDTELIAVFQFYLDKNLKLVKNQYDEKKQKGFVFFDFDTNEHNSKMKKKIKKQRLIFVAESESQFIIKSSKSNDSNLITLMIGLNYGNENVLKWSFQII